MKNSQIHSRILVIFILLFFSGFYVYAAYTPFTTNTSINIGVGTSTPQANFAVISGNVGIGTWTAAGGNLIVNGGNVGIGSAWPGQVLDVYGTARMTAFNMPTGAGANDLLTSDGNGNGTWVPNVAGGGWTLSGNNVYTGGSNNIGIGTTTPQAAFVVTNGNLGIGTWVANYAVSIGTAYGITSNGVAILQSASSNGNGGVVRTLGGSTFAGGEIDSRGGSAGGTGLVGVLQFLSGTSSGAQPEYMRLDKNGNLGIGTVAPVAALSIVGNLGIGNAASSQYMTNTPPSGGMIVQGSVGLATATTHNALDLNGSAAQGTYAGQKNAPSNGLIASGSLGVGTWAPTGALEIEGGNVGIGTFYNTASALTVMNGNVGLGTWTPDALLNVGATGSAVDVGDGSATSTNIYFANGSGAAGIRTGLGYDGANAYLSGNVAGNKNIELQYGSSKIGVIVASSNTNVSAGSVGFAPSATSANFGSYKMVVLSGGNVGIGTYTPSSSLDVVGNIGIGNSVNSPYVTTTPSKGAMIVQGSVGLGTYAPTGALEIEGGNVGIGTAFTSGAGEAALSVMKGNVGIGTWLPGASFVVKAAAPYAGTGVCWGTSGCLGYCTAGSWPNGSQPTCTTCNCL